LYSPYCRRYTTCSLPAATAAAVAADDDDDNNNNNNNNANKKETEKLSKYKTWILHSAGCGK